MSQSTQSLSIRPSYNRSNYRSSSLGDRRRSQKILTLCLSLLPITLYTLYKCYRFTVHRHIRTVEKTKSRSNDVTLLAGHFSQLIEQHSGGPMSNACVHACRRVSDTANDGGIVVFASGGWASCPHSQVPLPVYESPLQREWIAQDESDAQSEHQPFHQRIRSKLHHQASNIHKVVDQSVLPSICKSFFRSIEQTLKPSPRTLHLSPFETEQLDLYWLCRSLGQSRLYNTSFSVFLALAMQNNQTNDQSINQSTFTYQGRAIRLLSLHIGTFIPAIKRPVIDIVCEIGTVNRSKCESFMNHHWGQPPDIENPDHFAQVIDFGTQRISQYQEINHAMPAMESADVDDVIWHREHYSWTRDQDVWISFEVGASKSDDDSKDPSNNQSNNQSGKQRFHLDLSAAQYGLHAEPHYQTNNQSINVTPYLASLQTNNQSGDPFSIFQFAHPHPSAFHKSTVLSPPPTPYIISDEQLTSQGGSINQSITGTRAIIDFAQRVLIDNERHVNVEYSSFRRILSEACKERGISAKQVYQKKI